MPVDMRYLAEHPGVAGQVPLAAPLEQNRLKFSGGLSAPNPLASQPREPQAPLVIIFT